MKMEKRYIKQIADSETLFDMAAVCYNILENNISYPVKFISEYVDESASSLKNNPNCRRLRAFSDSAEDILEQYSEFEFSHQKLKIVTLLQNIELVPFQNDKENQLSVIYNLLSVIDSMTPLWNMQYIVNRAPLNKGKSMRNYLVYLAPSKYLHKDLIEKIGRERKRSADFAEGFSNLLFLQAKKLPRNSKEPEICYLPCKERDNQYQLKVAVITGVTGKHFTMPNTTGATKIIEYKPDGDVQKEVGEGLWSKIELAIRQGAEFIILPEFSVSNEILGYIKEKLCEYRKTGKDISNLIAVFPGSTWITSADNVHNNVQIILDSWGREIGRYYKNTPYRKKRKNAGGYEVSEGLSDPGYRTCILCVESIGYILPATCLDVIEGAYTEYLIQKFYPTFVFVPAWSSSGRSFKRPMKIFAAEYFVNSVLCNGCGALSKKASIVGGAVSVTKRGTVPDGRFYEVKKPAQCSNTIKQTCNKYCAYLFEIDLNPAKMLRKNQILISIL